VVNSTDKKDHSRVLGSGVECYDLPGSCEPNEPAMVTIRFPLPDFMTLFSMTSCPRHPLSRRMKTAFHLYKLDILASSPPSTTNDEDVDEASVLPGSFCLIPFRSNKSVQIVPMPSSVHSSDRIGRVAQPLTVSAAHSRILFRISGISCSKAWPDNKVMYPGQRPRCVRFLFFLLSAGVIRTAVLIRS
jgi:hypothetical protein